MRCSTLDTLLVDYLNAVAREQRARNAENMAYTQLLRECSRMELERSLENRRMTRRSLVEHGRFHGCCPDSELSDLGLSDDDHQPFSRP